MSQRTCDRFVAYFGGMVRDSVRDYDKRMDLKNCQNSVEYFMKVSSCRFKKMNVACLLQFFE